MKKISQNALMGVGIGSTIYVGMGILFASGDARLNSLLIIGMGLAIGALASIYDSQKLSLLVKSLCQSIGSYMIFLAVAYWGAWFPFEFEIIVTASLLFFGIFLFFWIVFYLKEKQEVAKINQKLNNL